MKKLLQRAMPLWIAMIANAVTTPAFAQSCGDAVPAHTTLVLSHDLSCPGSVSSGALVVPEGDVTIDLNGHAIVCTGTNCGVGATSAGIYAYNTTMNNVHIAGPGTISGFGAGIRIAAKYDVLGNARGASIQHVTITGPGDYGIRLSNAGAYGCWNEIRSIVSPPAPKFSITDNAISGWVEGIRVDQGYCGLVKNNVAADNNAHSWLSSF